MPLLPWVHSLFSPPLSIHFSLGAVKQVEPAHCKQGQGAASRCIRLFSVVRLVPSAFALRFMQKFTATKLSHCVLSFLHHHCVLSALLRVSVAPAGLSVPPELWRVSSSGRPARWCRWASRTWWNAPDPRVTRAATEVWWTRPSSTSRTTRAWTLRSPTLTWEPYVSLTCPQCKWKEVICLLLTCQQFTYQLLA